MLTLTIMMGSAIAALVIGLYLSAAVAEIADPLASDERVE